MDTEPGASLWIYHMLLPLAFLINTVSAPSGMMHPAAGIRTRRIQKCQTALFLTASFGLKKRIRGENMGF